MVLGKKYRYYTYTCSNAYNNQVILLNKERAKFMSHQIIDLRVAWLLSFKKDTLKLLIKKKKKLLAGNYENISWITVVLNWPKIYSFYNNILHKASYRSLSSFSLATHPKHIYEHAKIMCTRAVTVTYHSESLITNCVKVVVTYNPQHIYQKNW